MSSLSKCAAALGPQFPLASVDVPGAQEPVVGPRGLKKIQSANELCAECNSERLWIWKDYLARGAITCLTSRPKLGKTTLVSILLGKMAKGGQLAERPVSQGRAVVVSEEGDLHWRPRCRKLGYGDQVLFYCRPFDGKPSMEEWKDLIDEIAPLKSSESLDLVVIDTLATFMPGRDENNAGSMIDALEPLSTLAHLGLSVLILHHPRKARSLPGTSARGSGALSACVDILVEMRMMGRGVTDRRRRLHASSRFEQRERDLVIELNEAGTDYAALGGFEEAEFAGHWSDIERTLQEAGRKLTRNEIRAAWAGPGAPPPNITLWRLLVRAEAFKLVEVEGRGHRNKPFRYGLRERGGT